MIFRHRQLLGWSILSLAALLGGVWLARLDYSGKISTDALDLIPADERAPELTLVRSLASEAEARTMLFELTGKDGQPASTAAATSFVAALGNEPAFEQVVAMGDSSARDQLGKELFDRRFTLLFPLWCHEQSAAYAATGGPADGFSAWLARDATAKLSKFLTTPEALAFQDLVPADPLLLMPDAASRMQGVLAAPPATAGGSAATLVWARLSASPLSEAGQGPAFAAIDRAVAAARVVEPDFTEADTGVNRFAAASRARIEHEVAWLNALSLAAVLAVAFSFIRRVHRGLHLIPVVLFAMLGAWVCATLVFDRLHIMVFAVGSLLTGVAIDYGFYLFMQPAAFPGEEYPAKVRRLAKPLLASCLTTVAGFALLLFSELPFIRQLGVFVAAGLVSALLAAVIYFATVRDPFLEARAWGGGRGWSVGVRRGLRRLLLALWIIALPGLALLHWRDDIRELEIPSPALDRENDRIEALFGGPANRTVYLTYGSSVAEARASLETFETWLRFTDGGGGATFGLGSVTPTEATHAAALRFGREHPEFPAQFRAALDAGGFAAGAFAPFFDAYSHWTAGASAADLTSAFTAMQAKLTGPMGLLLHTGRPMSWFVTMADTAPATDPPAETHTVSADQLKSLNRIFSRYRQSAMWLSLIGLALVGAGVLLSYGWRDGARIFAIPCGACLGLFGWFGWLGHPLNLFHLLGAFLGVCLTHNYSIFTATSAYRGEATPVSVRISALTAASSFGVLALSGIPVVRALGSTVALMVLAALLAIEFEHLSSLGKKP